MEKIARLAAIIWISAALAACHSRDKKATEEPAADTAAAAEPSVGHELETMSRWTGFMERSSGGRFDVRKFTFINADTISLEASDPFERKDWEVFRPFLKYSPDSVYAIDLYSYGMVPVKQKDGSIKLEGGEPDSEVALVDTKTGRRARLLFSGPGITFQDARWLNDSVVMITGISEFNEQNRMLPVVWKVNLGNRTIETYEYGDSLTLQNDTYADTLLHHQ